MSIKICGMELSGDEEELDLSERPVSAEDIKRLAGLKKLGSLTVLDCGAVDLSPLSELEGLESLCADGRVRGIEALPALRQLTLCEAEDLSFLPAVSGLETLLLGDCLIRDLSPVSACGSLKELRITGYLNKDLTYFDITQMEKLGNIEDLFVISCPVGNAEPFGGLTGLRTLCISMTDRLADISPLSSLTGLETLIVDKNRIEDIGAVSEMKRLKRLYADMNRITDITPLSGLRELETLDLGVNRISDITPLGGLTGLGELSLYRNPLSDISPLFSLTGLKRCSIGLTGISAEDKERLERANPLCDFYTYM